MIIGKKLSTTKTRGPIFRQNLWGIGFAVPALVLLIIFSVYPLLKAFQISFTSWGLVDDPVYVGLDNYIKLFTRDPDFINSLKVTALYALGLNPIMWVVSLGLALILNQKIRLRGVFRTIFFTPVVVSWVVTSLVFLTIFHPSFGLNAQIMRAFFRAPGLKMLTSFSYALPSIMILSLWKGAGYYMVLFLAGLQDIPRDYYEASDVDGATSWQQFRFITLPLLKPTILFVVIISTINSFQVFTPIFLLTRGGPAGATRVLPILIYQNAFQFGKMGYASAMAVILFLILMFLTFVQLRFFRQDSD